MPVVADVQASPVVEFFFDCSCPWTYLAFVRLQETAIRTGARIRFRPVLVEFVLAAANPGLPVSRHEPNPARARYQAKDLKDWARFCGVRISLPASWPVRAELAQRGAVVADQLGMIVPYVAGIFGAHFGAGQDIGALPVVLDVAVAAGGDRGAFAAALAAPESLAAVKENSDELVARGGFGSPTLLIGDDLYFGNDRMPLVETALARASGIRFIMPGEHGA